MNIKKFYLWAVLAVTATATLTSCEDILGHWEKPTPAVPASAVVPEGIVKYMKWDAGQKKLVEAEVTEAEVTKVTDATTDASWSEGTYLVDKDVTINGKITGSGTVHLIIKDGCTLTVNGGIDFTDGDAKCLHIYGQSAMSGNLNVSRENFSAIRSLTSLDIHSCNVTATVTGTTSYCVNYTDINVYGGKLEAGSTATNVNGIDIYNKTLHIWGGEVRAIGKGSSEYGISGNYSSSVTLHGGKLYAAGTEGDESKAIYSGINITKEGTFTGKIEYRSSGTDWSETPNTSAKYIRAGY